MLAPMRSAEERSEHGSSTVAPARSAGFKKPREEWNVLLRDNHPGYISWQDYEDNQKLLLENAHMKKNCCTQIGAWWTRAC